MVTTIHQRGFVRHLWSWLQAIALVYLIGIAFVLLAEAIVLPVRGAIQLFSWLAALIR
jgi:hypothetical protein